MDVGNASIAKQISKRAFELGLIAETAGAEDQIVKLLPPLTITFEELNLGLDILSTAAAEALGIDIPRTDAAISTELAQSPARSIAQPQFTSPIEIHASV